MKPKNSANLNFDSQWSESLQDVKPLLYATIFQGFEWVREIWINMITLKIISFICSVQIRPVTCRLHLHAGVYYHLEDIWKLQQFSGYYSPHFKLSALNTQVSEHICFLHNEEKMSQMCQTSYSLRSNNSKKLRHCVVFCVVLSEF